MRSSALIERTERLVEQADQALHRTPSIQALTGLIRQLGALQRLLEGYGLQVSSTRHAAQPVAPVPHVDDDIGVVAPALRGFTADFQRVVTSLTAAGLRDGLEEVGLEAQSRHGEQPNGERRLPASEHLQPAHSPATPTALPQRQPLNVLEAEGSHEGTVQPRAPAGRAAAGRSPLRRVLLPVTNITQVKPVKPASPAGLLAAALVTGAETQQRAVAPRAPRRALTRPMIVPAASAAPPAAAPTKPPVPAHQITATTRLPEPLQAAVATAIATPRIQPGNRRSGLLPRRLPAAALSHGRLRAQDLAAADSTDWLPVRFTPAPGRDAAQHQDAAHSPRLSHAVGDEYQPATGPEHQLDSAEPDEDLQQLAAQLERLLRDEARRHGIEL